MPPPAAQRGLPPPDRCSRAARSAPMGEANTARSRAHLEKVALRIDEVHAAATAERIFRARIHSILRIISEGYPACTQPQHDLVELLRPNP